MYPTLYTAVNAATNVSIGIIANIRYEVNLNKINKLFTLHPCIVYSQRNLPTTKYLAVHFLLL